MQYAIILIILIILISLFYTLYKVGKCIKHYAIIATVPQLRTKTVNAIANCFVKKAVKKLCLQIEYFNQILNRRLLRED